MQLLAGICQHRYPLLRFGAVTSEDGGVELDDSLEYSFI